MTCEDCIHYDICANQNKLVQTDEHTWYEFAEIDNVEDYCLHFKDKADFAEVVHGEWIAEHEREGNYSHCSICECRCRGYVPNYKYCPNCGAKMDGVRKEQESDIK